MPVSGDCTCQPQERRKEIIEQYIENIQKDVAGLQRLKQSDRDSRLQPNTDLVRKQNDSLAIALRSLMELNEEKLLQMKFEPCELFGYLRPFDEIADWTLPVLCFKINHYRNLALSEENSLEALKVLPIEHLKKQSLFARIYEEKIDLLKEILQNLDKRVPVDLIPNCNYPSHSMQAKLILKIKRFNEEVRKSLIVRLWIDGREIEEKKYVKDRKRGNEPLILEYNAINHVHTCEVHFANKTTGQVEKFISFRLSWLEDYFKSPHQVDRKFVGRLELVPAGSVDVEISLSPAEVEATIKRSGAVIYPAIHELGHRLVHFSHSYLQSLRCAHCGDTTSISAWYRCENCRFLCHKNCVNQIYNRCLPNPNYATHEALTIELQRQGKPHQFYNTKSSKGYCMHCGHSVSNGYKCSGCKGCVHEECEVYVPSFCGLQRKEAIRIKESFLEDPNSEGLLQKKKSFRIPEGDVSKINAGWHNFVEDDFEYISMIGKGNFGKVFLARVKKTGLLVALKVLKKYMIIENDEGDSIKAEKAVLALNAHGEKSKFLLKCYGVFHTPTRLFFVMEYVGGGDLMFHIQKKSFTMEQVIFAAAEVLLALEFLHRQDIVYRDLKLDNILMNVDGHLKLADYGLCKLNMHGDKTTSTYCGTPEFIAPEIVLKKPYDRRVDWWAFGVLLYEMLFNRPPFKGADDNHLIRIIPAGQYTIPDTATPESKDIIQKLLVVDPKRRLGAKKGAAEIKKHPFFNGVDFDKLTLAGVKSPFRPNIAHPTDVSNFDSQFTMQPAELSPATSLHINSKFTGFFDCLVGQEAVEEGMQKLAIR